MSWLSNAFGGKNVNPADKANEYLSQIPEAIRPYFQQYMDQGTAAGGKLSGQYDQMTQDPGAFFANMGKGYQQSPGYQFKLQQALNAGQNSSAAGGMLGTPQDQQQQMGIANGIASQDYEDYIKHIMDLFGQGQAGQQQFQQQGFNASQNYGQDIGDVMGKQAQNAYEGQAAENARRGNNWSNLFKVGGAFAGGLAGALNK